MLHSDLLSAVSRHHVVLAVGKWSFAVRCCCIAGQKCHWVVLLGPDDCQGFSVTLDLCLPSSKGHQNFAPLNAWTLVVIGGKVIQPSLALGSRTSGL